MKALTKKKSHAEVLALPREKYYKPLKQHAFWRWLMKFLSSFELRGVRFEHKEYGMEKLGKEEPCLVLMNHCSFIDLEIGATLLADRPFNVVVTLDAMMGKGLLMRLIGCIPTKKFVTDTRLVKSMLYCVKDLKQSVLMYPEAGYSFDGTATTLPDSLGSFIKLLDVPVVMIETHGAFTRNPLYNNLHRRKVQVTADMKYILSPEEIKEKTVTEINEIVRTHFSFDYFRWQQENKIEIKEKNRAEGLNRVLYKCPSCLAESKMEGEGIHLTCTACGKQYELDEYGFMKALEGETEFSHVPDWYRWERECVKKEILDGTYYFDVPVDICMLVDSKCLYDIGQGRLLHTEAGFRIEDLEGNVYFSQKPSATYTLNSDYYWYEIGDVIGLGDSKALYYCFPKEAKDIVAKARLATEEMYKIAKAAKRK